MTKSPLTSSRNTVFEHEAYLSLNEKSNAFACIPVRDLLMGRKGFACLGTASS